MICDILFYATGRRSLHGYLYIHRLVRGHRRFSSSRRYLWGVMPFCKRKRCGMQTCVFRQLRPDGDITKISTERIPDHDVLFTGFPCQPFSIIGNRLGFDDIRGTLFFEIARILHAKKPSMFILENVKQLSRDACGRLAMTGGRRQGRCTVACLFNGTVLHKRIFGAAPRRFFYYY